MKAEKEREIKDAEEKIRKKEQARLQALRIKKEIEEAERKRVEKKWRAIN